MNKTVVITGVTRGLGRAMADEFIHLGHTVFGCARTKDQIEKLVRIYPKHNFQCVDVASDAKVKTWAKVFKKKHGAPDFVLNNAAILNFKAPLWQVGDQDFSNEIDINIKGSVNVIRHFTPLMIDQGSGVIINFCSRWGSDFEKEMAPYCATKWAVVALTRVLAQELKFKGVAAVGLNPGLVKTDMLQQYFGNDPALNTSNYLTPINWAKIAVPFILRLGLKDNGKIRKIPPEFNRAQPPMKTNETYIPRYKAGLV